MSFIDESIADFTDEDKGGFKQPETAGDRGYVDNSKDTQAEADGPNLTAEIQKIKQLVESVAKRFESDYRTELEMYLQEYGTKLNPAIRTKLASELEQ